MSDSGGAIVLIARLLAVMFCAFLGVFALDAFTGHGTAAEQFNGFLVHLSPVGILAVFVAIAWWRPAIGAVTFLFAGSVYAWFARDHLSWLVAIAMPMWIIGILYFMSARALARHPQLSE